MEWHTAQSQKDGGSGGRREQGHEANEVRAAIPRQAYPDGGGYGPDQVSGILGDGEWRLSGSQGPSYAAHPRGSGTHSPSPIHPGNGHRHFPSKGSWALPILSTLCRLDRGRAGGAPAHVESRLQTSVAPKLPNRDGTIYISGRMRGLGTAYAGRGVNECPHGTCRANNATR